MSSALQCNLPGICCIDKELYSASLLCLHKSSSVRCIVLHYFAMHCSAMHCIVLSCIACGSPWLCITPMQWTPPALIWSSLASLPTLQLCAHHAHQLKLYTYYRKFFSRKSLGKQYVECLEWSYQGLNTTVNIVQCIAKDKERGDERIDDNIRYNPI